MCSVRGRVPAKRLSTSTVKDTRGGLRGLLAGRVFLGNLAGGGKPGAARIRIASVDAPFPAGHFGRKCGRFPPDLIFSPMTTETTPPRSLGAVMSSEAGYEADVDDSPLRVSGFIALILAALSGFTIVAVPMVGFAIAAVLFALFALRKSDSVSIPTGTTAARLAILLAVLFGTWGVARYGFKVNTLGSQAEYFARQFVRVASSGNEIYAKELQKSYVNRYLKTMPLEASYALERQKREQQARQMTESMADEGYGEDGPPGEDEDSTIPDLVKYDVDHPWVLFRPVRVYSHYGRQKAEVVLATDYTEDAFRLMIVLEYLIHKETGTGEWYVDTCLPYRERIVADSIL